MRDTFAAMPAASVSVRARGFGRDVPTVCTGFWTMRMRPIATTELPEEGTLEFKPGGKHAMLFGIDPAVKPGGKISLTFSVTPTGQIVTDADVVGPGGTAPGHAGH